MTSAPIRYVVEDVDRHGRVRVYFRKDGQRKVRIRAAVGSPEFWTAYNEALAASRSGLLDKAKSGGAERGSLQWIAQRWFASGDFKSTGLGTQRVKRRVLESMLDEPIKTGSDLLYGQVLGTELTPKGVAVLRDRKLGLPEAANARVKVMRQMLAWAGVTRGAGIWATNEDKVQPCAKLDWIIVGGESGANARPMHPEWVRSIRDQCCGRDDRLHLTGLPDVAFFFKQWGEWVPVRADRFGGDDGGKTFWPHDCVDPGDHTKPLGKVETRWSEFDLGKTRDMLCGKVGKSRAGRLLDGIEHNAMPSAATPPRHPGEGRDPDKQTPARTESVA